MRMICNCELSVAHGLSAAEDCSASIPHESRRYECSACDCREYRPRIEPRGPDHWPKCTCGDLAQDHS